MFIAANRNQGYTGVVNDMRGPTQTTPGYDVASHQQTDGDVHDNSDRTQMNTYEHNEDQKKDHPNENQQTDHLAPFESAKHFPVNVLRRDKRGKDTAHVIHYTHVLNNK